jgi:putative membrane protein
MTYQLKDINVPWQCACLRHKSTTGYGKMVYLIINWVLSAVSLLILSSVLPGFRILEVQSAILATGLVGLVSAFVGMLLKQVVGRVIQLMSGAFLFLVDVFLFRLIALLVPGFAMEGMYPAFIGAAALLGLNIALLRYLRHEESFDVDLSTSSRW